MMLHSVYSDKDVFLRELISNAADACEKLRYELLSDPALAGDDGQPRITVTLDPAARRLIVADSGIGMREAELAVALGTIARSGHRAFLERGTPAKALGRECEREGVCQYGELPLGDRRFTKKE